MSGVREYVRSLRAWPGGWAGVRLCNLAAQGSLTEGPIQAGSGEGTGGRESEPWEIICCKLYKTQIPIIEQAIETAA